MTTDKIDRPPSDGREPADPAQLIRDTLDKLKFGAIQLTVHEGKLVQMEVTEKHRFA